MSLFEEPEILENIRSGIDVFLQEYLRVSLCLQKQSRQPVAGIVADRCKRFAVEQLAGLDMCVLFQCHHSPAGFGKVVEIDHG